MGGWLAVVDGGGLSEWLHRSNGYNSCSLLCSLCSNTNMHGSISPLSLVSCCLHTAQPVSQALSMHCSRRLSSPRCDSHSFRSIIGVSGRSMASAAAGRFVARASRLASASTSRSILSSRPLAPLSSFSRTSLLCSSSSFSRHIRFAHDEAPTGPKIQSARPHRTAFTQSALVRWQRAAWPHSVARSLTQSTSAGCV